ncbi:MAG: ComF family protein [Glaciecola sp.]|jgi:ComF family protein
MLKQLLTFVYPQTCFACNRELRADETQVCMHCQQDIPTFDFEKMEGNEAEKNPVFQLFWGKSNVHYATSCYEYVKGEKLQNLIHELKYKGRKNLAKFFGEIMAREINVNLKFQDIDAICFVPSSQQKTRKRGYNQAQELATSISKSAGKPCLDILAKKKNTASQTSKNVHDRHFNLENSFAINKKVTLLNNCKHILLIDDVITTGATLNACAKIIEGNFDVKVSVLTLAFRHL